MGEGVARALPATSAPQALIRLAAWLSPAFPVGAFAYSGGLEQAIRSGAIGDAEGLQAWITALIGHGAGWNDAVLLAEAYRRSEEPEALRELATLAEAMSGGRERHLEVMSLGEAFLTAASAWPHPALEALQGRAAYPVAVGAVAGAHKTGLEAALAAFLQAMVSTLASVAIRCSLIGQRQAVILLAALEPLSLAQAARAAESDLDGLGTATLLADIASLAHETLEPRLFRS
ncbi:urease accessory protein UreF [Rhizobium sp. YIM 134829]|uniref:urease accessory protein UreF n=1 Tax=Rhizobium sp. YIM 134829 TaxID=3390453 RepID=UPI0039780110